LSKHQLQKINTFVVLTLQRKDNEGGREEGEGDRGRGMGRKGEEGKREGIETD
jgi:hypothetical protein